MREDESNGGATPAAGARVLKGGETFGVFDARGDLVPLAHGEHGLFHGGTRHLCRLLLRVGRRRPILLGSTVRQDNASLEVDLANPELRFRGGVAPQETVHLWRSRILEDGRSSERLRVRNYGHQAVHMILTLAFAADFADIFEVRGVERRRRGRILKPVVEHGSLQLAYEGLDGVLRRTVLRFLPPPDRLRGGAASWRLELAPGALWEMDLEILCLQGEAELPPRRRFALAQEQAALHWRALDGRWCQVHSDRVDFDAWLARSRSDLGMLETATPQGPYVYAGVPWFSTPFGRDALITGLATCWARPDLAAGILRWLAATQATEEDPFLDAEPGKILHEARGGEMAALGEVPFRRYYGSVDATPLFVMLAGEAWRCTGDEALLEEIWPAVLRALEWMSGPGDPNGDGFLEYRGRSPRGLVHQGWKDSGDSVFHADGSDAEPPIALCEVQAYAYGAWRAAARLARGRGEAELAARWEARAAALRTAFDRAFWDPELGSYVLALDGAGQPCRVRTTNAGHALYTGIALPQRAQALARTLLGEDLFSGWGLRTLAVDAVRYNPMSYHNGSVWPHDTALVAAGLARYGQEEAAVRLLTALADLAREVEMRRLPELVCGFPRRPGQGPVLYPVACSPQAWAAAVPYLLIQACLGLEPDAPARQLRLHHPFLPPFLNRLRLEGLRVGESELDLEVHRHPEDVGICVLRRRGPAEVLVVK